MTRRRFGLLALAQVAVGVLTQAAVVTGSVPDGNRALRLVLSGCWLVLAAFTWFGLPRLPWWSLDATLTASALIIAAATLSANLAQVQMLEAFGLLVLGAFGTYTLPTRRLWTLMGVAVTCYALALLANPLLTRPWIGVLTVALVLGNTAMVARQMDAIRAASLTDPLTGALNRRGLQERAPAVRSVAERAGQPTTVAMIDVDDFKRYNDERGHAAGDDLLVALVALWSGSSRPGDLVGRVGGDEFVIVLPNAGLDQAVGVMSRLRASSPVPWTFGLSDWHPQEDVLDAVARADTSMFAFKRTRTERATHPAEPQ